MSLFPETPADAPLHPFIVEHYRAMDRLVDVAIVAASLCVLVAAAAFKIA